MTETPPANCTRLLKDKGQETSREREREKKTGQDITSSQTRNYWEAISLGARVSFLTAE